MRVRMDVVLQVGEVTVDTIVFHVTHCASRLMYALKTACMLLTESQLIFSAHNL